MLDGFQQIGDGEFMKQFSQPVVVRLAVGRYYFIYKGIAITLEATKDGKVNMTPSPKNATVTFKDKDLDRVFFIGPQTSNDHAYVFKLYTMDEHIGLAETETPQCVTDEVIKSNRIEFEMVDNPQNFIKKC